MVELKYSPQENKFLGEERRVCKRNIVSSPTGTEAPALVATRAGASFLVLLLGS
jgi:hypothetical protein